MNSAWEPKQGRIVTIKRVVVERSVGRKKQHTSHLKTETTTFQLSPFDKASRHEIDQWNRGFVVDELLADVRDLASDFLIERSAPPADVADFNRTALKSWVNPIESEQPGLLDAFNILSDLSEFQSLRPRDPEQAYARLLRLCFRSYALAVARLEVGYFAGKARNGHSEKTAEMLNRRKRFLNTFYSLMDEGHRISEAKRLASRRESVPRSTVARWFNNAELKKLYHSFTRTIDSQ